MSDFFYPGRFSKVFREKCLLITLLLLPLIFFLACRMAAEQPATSVHHHSQGPRFRDMNLFLYGDFDYTTNLGMILFSASEMKMAMPIIRYNSQETLFIRFDDLDADYKSYYYTIIHCDAHWQPSRISEMEYIDGFMIDQIINYSFSMNTIIPFTQYTLEFPNQNMRPRLPGNYLLKVFVDGDPNNVAFTRRFMVFDQRLPVMGNARLANLVAFRDTHHQISFSIDMSPYHISNPYTDLKVVIRQNGRWDNAITGIQPRMIRGNQLIYDYEEQLLFEAGNEFRRFDMRSLRHVSEFVENISPGSRHWDVFLTTDRPRAYRQYTTQSDINGRFHIQTYDAPDNNLEADYAWVHFRLAMDEPLSSGSLHIMGDLTQWAMSAENQMTYNYRMQQYETSLLLKQGLYNYWYVFREEGDHAGSVCYFEGCYSQTENEYTILVYHQPPGSLTDHLVGLGLFSSSFVIRR
jgi:hypothetical protein